MTVESVPFGAILPLTADNPGLLLRASRKAQARLGVLRRWWAQSEPPSYVAALLDPNHLYWLRVLTWDESRLEGRLWLSSGLRGRRARGELICLQEAEIVDWFAERSKGVFEGAFILREMRALRQTRRLGVRLSA